LFKNLWCPSGLAAVAGLLDLGCSPFFRVFIGESTSQKRAQELQDGKHGLMMQWLIMVAIFNDG
jgi:hypothetical protein